MELSDRMQENANQASAGTGKSFLLNTVYLYCLVHNRRCKAAAPTGRCCSYCCSCFPSCCCFSSRVFLFSIVVIAVFVVDVAFRQIEIRRKKF